MAGPSGLHACFPAAGRLAAKRQCCHHTHPAACPPACLPALQAYAPRYPLPKEENWYFLLADPAAVSQPVTPAIPPHPASLIQPACRARLPAMPLPLAAGACTHPPPIALIRADACSCLAHSDSHSPQ